MSRAKYDAKGEQALKDSPSTTDAHQMFDLLFGLSDLEPLIGVLRVEDLVDPDRSASAPVNKREQARRRVELAMRLRGRLDPYAVGGVEAPLFCREQSAEASKLCSVRR